MGVGENRDGGGGNYRWGWGKIEMGVGENKDGVWGKYRWE
jgi:hypothetical protein